jgi:hypothetical protein
MRHSPISRKTAAATLDFKGNEVEDCEFIVAGETWHKIAAFINRLAR